MDYKKIENKDLLKEQITKLLEEYNKMFISLTDENQHKSAILYYWLKDYREIIGREKTFNPLYLKEYSRGSIIKAKFGFNVGNEYGGLHYAVVIENNDRKSGVITVIPLRSVKDKDKQMVHGSNIIQVHSSELNLGNDIFVKCSNKIFQERNTLENELKEITAMRDDLKNQLQNIKQVFSSIEDRRNISLLQENISSMDKNLESCENKIKSIGSKLSNLQDWTENINKMKSGSIALVKNITTISKMRIVNPINENDILSNIKVSNYNLDCIDSKIKNFFIK